MPSASRCTAPDLGDQPLDQFAHQSTQNPHPSCRRYRRYSWRELASPQKEYHTETLRGLAISGSRYSSTSSSQRPHRDVLELRHRQQHPLFELGRQILQRCHQHRRLGVEVEPHDARRQIGKRHHLLDRRARRAVDMQRRDAGVDQPLTLADARGPPGAASTLVSTGLALTRWHRLTAAAAASDRCECEPAKFVHRAEFIAHNSAASTGTCLRD